MMHLKHNASAQMPPRTAKRVPNGFEQSAQGMRSPPRMSIRANLVIVIPPSVPGHQQFVQVPAFVGMKDKRRKNRESTFCILHSILDKFGSR